MFPLSSFLTTHSLFSSFIIFFYTFFVSKTLYSESFFLFLFLTQLSALLCANFFWGGGVYLSRLFFMNSLSTTLIFLILLSIFQFSFIVSFPVCLSLTPFLTLSLSLSLFLSLSLSLSLFLTRSFTHTRMHINLLFLSLFCVESLFGPVSLFPLFLLIHIISLPFEIFSLQTNPFFFLFFSFYLPALFLFSSCFHLFCPSFFPFISTFSNFLLSLFSSFLLLFVHILPMAPFVSRFPPPFSDPSSCQ
ncbi:unnamed protein product [Acanthosepion pharaonis]|uniref:Uncharacterized protein n=1 Tax=Acanthosepion pharaonis TaxID=158019 RepID=A0A812BAV6_ACAPH|nr:unnamed protein product [Sepia pharaonis]